MHNYFNLDISNEQMPFSKKESFETKESGIIGHFTFELFGQDYYPRIEKTNFICFAPGLTEFDHSSYKGVVANHRFLKFIRDKFPTYTVMPSKERFADSCGGFIANYSFNDGIFEIVPRVKRDYFGFNEKLATKFVSGLEDKFPSHITTGIVKSGLIIPTD